MNAVVFHVLKVLSFKRFTLQHKEKQGG